jgi:hypothetical protein
MRQKYKICAVFETCICAWAKTSKHTYFSGDKYALSSILNRSTILNDKMACVFHLFSLISMKFGLEYHVV